MPFLYTECFRPAFLMCSITQLCSLIQFALGGIVNIVARSWLTCYYVLQSALIGAILSIITCCWLMMGALVQGVRHQSLPTSVIGCPSHVMSSSQSYSMRFYFEEYNSTMLTNQSELHNYNQSVTADEQSNYSRYTCNLFVLLCPRCCL